MVTCPIFNDMECLGKDECLHEQACEHSYYKVRMNEDLIWKTMLRNRNKEEL